MLRPVLLATLLSLFSRTLPAESNWPHWRGPGYDGHAREANLPLAWTKDDIAWKSPLPGRGQSNPVLWGERIFLTAATGNGKQRLVLCLNRNDGKILWERTAHTMDDPERVHPMNSYASATCATDGERVYAFFGKGGGLFCYTVDGELVWSKELGAFEGPWGTAASPILFGNLVIQNCDAEKTASIVAFDKKTGVQAWKTPREPLRGWSTPIVIRADGRDEIVVNGDTGPRAYDPASGKELWHCRSFNGRGEPTVTQGPTGLLYVLNGKRGDFYAVRPGGSGNVTGTHMAWHTPRNTGRDLPSPIVLGNQVLTISLNGGILTSYDAESGRELWKERISGNFSASPVAWGERAFFLNEAGETTVVDPTASGDTRVVGRNEIEPPDDEVFRASPTPSEGQLFLRSDRALYCVGRRGGSDE